MDLRTRHAPAHLDGRAGNRSAVGPDLRRRQIAMEAMLCRLEPNDSPTRLAEDEPRRNGELVDKRRQRMLQRRRQLNRRGCSCPRGRTVRRNDPVRTSATLAGSNHQALTPFWVSKYVTPRA